MMTLDDYMVGAITAEARRARVVELLGLGIIRKIDQPDGSAVLVDGPNWGQPL